MGAGTRAAKALAAEGESELLALLLESSPELLHDTKVARMCSARALLHACDEASQLGDSSVDTSYLAPALLKHGRSDTEKCKPAQECARLRGLSERMQVPKSRCELSHARRVAHHALACDVELLAFNENHTEAEHTRCKKPAHTSSPLGKQKLVQTSQHTAATPQAASPSTTHTSPHHSKSYGSRRSAHQAQLRNTSTQTDAPKGKPKQREQPSPPQEKERAQLANMAVESHLGHQPWRYTGEAADAHRQLSQQTGVEQHSVPFNTLICELARGCAYQQEHSIGKRKRSPESALHLPERDYRDGDKNGLVAAQQQKCRSKQHFALEQYVRTLAVTGRRSSLIRRSSARCAGRRLPDTMVQQLTSLGYRSRWQQQHPATCPPNERYACTRFPDNYKEHKAASSATAVFTKPQPGEVLRQYAHVVYRDP